MQCRTPKRMRNLGFEPLEGRVLQSGTAIDRPNAGAAAHVAQMKRPKITGSSGGETAILNAYFGGAGHEFVMLAQREVKNLFAVIRGFESGTITQYSVPGLAVKIPNLQSGYTGLPHDPLSENVGGASLVKGKRIELGCIVRGPFTTYPGTTYIVFALNRGAGARLGPEFAGRPGITPDALVTVTVGPYGDSNSATITDLTTGSTQPLSPAVIRVKGPTVRVLVPISQLPSEGFPVNRYTFAVWSAIDQDGGFQSVGSFVPENAMILIGVLTNVQPTL
jgi:hypothetical protein